MVSKRSAGKSERKTAMGVEVEIKLKIEDRDKVAEALRQLGFEDGALVVETDTYYTAAHHDFAAGDEALRIRSVENLNTGEKSAAITYKGAKLDKVSMSRHELETEIGDALVGRSIFEHIGFVPVTPVEKRRQYMRSSEVTACVDAVKGLGDYLELEIITDSEESRPQALKKIENILQEIGYSMDDTTRISYLTMLLNKNKQVEMSDI